MKQKDGVVWVPCLFFVISLVLFFACSDDNTDGLNSEKLNGTFCTFYLPANSVHYEDAKRFVEYSDKMIPKIAELIKSPLPSKKISLYFRNIDAVAMAGHYEVIINSQHVPRELGFLIHEFVHVFQAYPNHIYQSHPWLVEGMCDFIRNKLDNTTDSPNWFIGCAPGEDFQSGYRCTAAFLTWLEVNYPDVDLYQELDEMLLNEIDLDTILLEITGEEQGSCGKGL